MSHFGVLEDPEGGYNVLDLRCGDAIAWRSDLKEAVAIATHLDCCYPEGAPAPAWDSLVHEIRMDRIGGEPVEPLHLLDPGELYRMVPEAIGGPLDHGLWRPLPRGE